jgi:ABC-2 type transport system ATP-binding protein
MVLQLDNFQLRTIWPTTPASTVPANFLLRTVDARRYNPLPRTCNPLTETVYTSPIKGNTTLSRPIERNLSGPGSATHLPCIQVRGLERKFGSFTAVDQLSFDVNEGEVFGLLGPNGAGKTTTIRLLTCLIPPTSGSASVCGFEVTKDPTRVRGLVGIQTENPCLYERLSAYENMDFFAQAYGVSNPQERSSRIREVLEFFNLWEKRSTKADHLSKGMKQKLALARALVHKPQVLLLDEPTAGLDPESAREVRNMITQLSSKERRTILLSTHHLEDAEKLCDRVMIVNRGRRITDGTPDSLRKRAGAPMLEVTLKTDSDQLAESIRKLPTVKSVTTNDLKQLLIALDDPDSATPEIVTAIVNAGGQILSVKPLVPSLEEIYLQIVKDNHP